MKTIISILMAAMLLASCSSLDIQRRHYRNGFYINNSSTNHAMKDTATTIFDLNHVHPDTVPTPKPGTVIYFYNYPMDGAAPVCKKDSSGDVYIGSPLTIKNVTDVDVKVEDSSSRVYKDWFLCANLNVEYTWKKLPQYSPPAGGSSGVITAMIVLGWILLAAGIFCIVTGWSIWIFIPAILLLVFGYLMKWTSKK